MKKKFTVSEGTQNAFIGRTFYVDPIEKKSYIIQELNSMSFVASSYKNRVLKLINSNVTLICKQI
jgi:hypothetical protein